MILLMVACARASEPPPGTLVPGEMKLAGPLMAASGSPVETWLWAVRPKPPYFHSAVRAREPAPAELTVGLFDAEGGELARVQPRFRAGKWRKIQLAEDGLPPGEYEIAALMTYDGVPFNRVTKRLIVVDPDEPSGRTILDAASLADALNLEVAADSSGRKAVRVPKDREIKLPVPGAGERVAVHGLFQIPAPGLSAAIDGKPRDLPALRDREYAVREQFLGYARAGTDTLALKSGEDDFRLLHLRFEPVPGNPAADPKKRGNAGKQIFVNNDGFSEGFFDPEWDPRELPEQVDRYQNTDVSVFEWTSLVSDVANYRSAHADFYGEGFQGEWPGRNYRAAHEHYVFLQQHDPPMFPWLVQRGEAIGVPVWGSLRMSTGYGAHPFGRVFNGKFWFENPAMRLKRTPDEADDNDNFLSYAYAPVRESRLGVLREMVGFGCEGVNLDFCRYPEVMGYDQPLLERFEATHGESGAAYTFDHPKWISVRQEFFNEFMRGVRKAMNEAGEERGAPVRISARLPATHYATFGFDPETWVREGLVDVLIPAFPGNDRWADPEPWLEMVRGTDVLVLPGIEYHIFETSQSELTDEEIERGVEPGYQFKQTRENYLRRAADAYAAGAHGMYLFNNWKRPEMWRGVSDAEFVESWRRDQDPENLHSELTGEAYAE